MAIHPTSDIVLDVARAADPDRAAAVAKKLNALAANASSPSGDLTATLANMGATSATARAGVADMRARIGSVSDATSTKASKAEVQFEAVLLNSFIGEMLPKDAPETYGHGVAGEMWRSLLAEKISNQIAGSGALGLGERLFATHPLSATSQLTHAMRSLRAGASATAQMSANELSLPSGANVADNSFLFVGKDKS